MRYKVILLLISFLAIGAQSTDCDQKKESKMDAQPIVVKVRCKGDDQCLFDGKDIFLDISLYNDSKEDVRFPLEYRKKRGPIIKLIDARTKAETFVPTHIADWDLKEKYTVIRPAQSISFEWVLTADDLDQFGSDVDVFAEVTIMPDILLGTRKVEFKGSDTRHIVKKK